MIAGDSPFRMYPTKTAGPQKFESPQAVCHSCLSGTCCSSEDPIYLTAFDILRLSAYFDLSPAQWMLRFTQDRFEGEDSDWKRRSFVEDPNSSVVTHLRRRANAPTSPCVFLTYIREADGTPRRVCGVHPARPLSCREYYFDTCQTRWTGELATLQAEGLEQVRDGKINAEVVARELARMGEVDAEAAPMSVLLEQSFWIEMKRALDLDATNHEGVRSFDLEAYQDPIDEKLNRMLSSAWLRLEEKYGPVPWGEQLHSYEAGLSFAGTVERARLMGLTERAPGKNPVFGAGDYPHYIAGRASLLPMPVGRFRSLSEEQIERLVSKVDERERALLHGALRGAEALVRFASFVAEADRLLETAPAGTIERELLFALSRIEAAAQRCWKLHPGLRQAQKWAANKADLPESWRKRLTKKSRVKRELWLESQSAYGTWRADPSASGEWPESQADYWLTLLRATTNGVIALD